MITMPWPPSVNHYWRNVNGSWVVRVCNVVGVVMSHRELKISRSDMKMIFILVLVNLIVFGPILLSAIWWAR